MNLHLTPHATPWRVLRSAARYIEQFRGRIFVLKLGGELLADPAVRRGVCEQLMVLKSFSIPLVVVHGGGCELDRLCQQLSIPVNKAGGRRITSRDVLEVAKMTFAGTLHTDLLADMRAAGLSAVGLTGLDAGLVEAVRRPPVTIDGVSTDFGEVGDIRTVRPAVIHQLIDAGHVPVVAPLTGDDQGAVFNTNADTLAAELAGALQAEKLFFLLCVPGLLQDVNDPASLVTEIDPVELDIMVADGRISNGMKPKAAAVNRALAAGVKNVHLISGVRADALLEEVFTNEGSGTMVHDTQKDNAAATQEVSAHVG